MSFRYLSNDPMAVAGDEVIIVTTKPGIDWPVPGKPHNPRRQSQKNHKPQRLPEGNGGDTKKRRDNDVPGQLQHQGQNQQRYHAHEKISEMKLSLEISFEPVFSLLLVMLSHFSSFRNNALDEVGTKNLK